MERNEMIKALYREKPTAKVCIVNDVIARKGIIVYEAELKDGTKAQFDVRVNDMGDAPVSMTMPGQLLIRYLV